MNKKTCQAGFPKSYNLLITKVIRTISNREPQIIPIMLAHLLSGSTPSEKNLYKIGRTINTAAIKTAPINDQNSHRLPPLCHIFDANCHGGLSR